MFGFVIVSHNQPSQLARLCTALTELYCAPPIVCHHDFAQSSVDHSAFSDNVSFVDNPERTGWGEWSVTSGVMRSIKLLYRDHNPAWFTLLSAADFPIKSAAYVQRVLENCGADALMDLRPLRHPSPQRHFGKEDPALVHHSDEGLATKRYLHARIALSSTNNVSKNRSFRIPVKSPFRPFDNDYLCYVGSQWFTANRSCANTLLNLSSQDLRLMRYLQSRWHADECFINTVLGNSRDLRIYRNPYRFTRWHPDAPSPETLEMHDQQSMKASSAFFARKFAVNAPVIAEIEKSLLSGDDHKEVIANLRNE